MGRSFADRYSLLHFASGVVAQFWGLDGWTWAMVHLVFELTENTRWGMRIINALPFWPGGKDFADSPLNMLGDELFALAGHWCANLINGKRKE